MKKAFKLEPIDTLFRKNCFNVMSLQERYKKIIFVPTMFYHEIMCKKVMQLQFTTECGRLQGIKSI